MTDMEKYIENVISVLDLLTEEAIKLDFYSHAAIWQFITGIFLLEGEFQKFGKEVYAFAKKMGRDPNYIDTINNLPI
uniref:Uncharacterized protein n=1 Tax=viral metagenome TaxID=1070528 RepID=A0A6M3KLQ9_9ZZZZ